MLQSGDVAEPLGLTLAFNLEGREPKRQTASDSSSFRFKAAMAEGNSKCMGLSSEGTRGALERSRDRLDSRFVFRVLS